MISEESCDAENWSNIADISDLHHSNRYIVSVYCNQFFNI